MTAYNYTFYALVARGDHGRGTPLAFCISSDDTSDIVKLFLEALKISSERSGFIFKPRYTKCISYLVNSKRTQSYMHSFMLTKNHF